MGFKKELLFGVAWLFKSIGFIDDNDYENLKFNTFLIGGGR